MLTVRQIEIFRAVMITKTVSGAARMLGTSQPGLSRMLGHMEDRLQFRLFDRTRGRLVPTQEAGVLFEEIERIYKGFDDLAHVIRRLAKGEDKTFRVGASPSLGHSILPQMLARLSANYPGLTIQFDILSVEQAIDYLALQRGEYALTVFPIDHPNILSSRIGAGRMVCAVPSHHPLADRDRIGVADLAGAQLQSFRPDTPHGRIIAETAVAFVANGMGVALVDSFTAMQPHADTVRFLEFEDPGVLPVYINRNMESPRAIIGETFEEIARSAMLALPRPPKP
jgi:DNA-binding transcriptional LysR family regulator